MELDARGERCVVGCGNKRSKRGPDAVASEIKYEVLWRIIKNSMHPLKNVVLGCFFINETYRRKAEPFTGQAIGHCVGVAYTKGELGGIVVVYTYEKAVTFFHEFVPVTGLYWFSEEVQSTAAS